MQCAGLQDHSDPAPSRGPDHIRLAYQQFKVWELTWWDLLTQFLQHFFSLSLSTRMGTSWLNFCNITPFFHFLQEGGTSWLNFSILFLTFTFFREGDLLTQFSFYFSLSLSLGRETSWLWPATPTMEIHCQPSNGTNRESTSPLRWRAEQKDEKEEVTKILPSRRFLWSLTRTVWQSWPSQWIGETMTWCIVVRWVMASMYCLLPIAYCLLPIDMVYSCEVSYGFYLLPIAYCLLTWCIVLRWVMATAYWGSTFFCKLRKFLLEFSNIHNVLISKQMQFGDFF